MTNKEILQKAVRKIANETGLFFLIPKTFPTALIFSHDFAKAFWGDRLVCLYCGTSCEPWIHCCGNHGPISNWEYHLQQMVLEKEPLKYLEKFLDKE